MLSNSGQPRTYMRNNEWFNAGGEGSPSAKYLKVKYPNGDVATVEFINLDSLDAANKRYAETPVDDWGIEYPITVVEVTMIAANSNIRFGPKETTIGGINLKNNFSAFCGAGLTVG
ncbi:hypothetical protein TDB9533_03174 [Thalassocella blandensis]|nr:hypothetical protein TDB9533_03174 [Thalassocella blandensis]